MNGKFHRENGPAIEHVNGTKEWYINGKRHREDGPAIERNDGSKEWFLNNISYSEEDYYSQIKKLNKTCKLHMCGQAANANSSCSSNEDNCY